MFGTAPLAVLLDLSFVNHLKTVVTSIYAYLTTPIYLHLFPMGPPAHVPRYASLLLPVVAGVFILWLLVVVSRSCQNPADSSHR